MLDDFVADKTQKSEIKQNPLFDNEEVIEEKDEEENLEYQSSRSISDNSVVGFRNHTVSQRKETSDPIRAFEAPDEEMKVDDIENNEYENNAYEEEKGVPISGKL